MGKSKSVELGAEIYKLVRKLPPEEEHVLSEMLLRAIGEIAANVSMFELDLPQDKRAEFLSTARGKVAVIETLLQICVTVKYLEDAEVATALNLCAELGRMSNEP